MQMLSTTIIVKKGIKKMSNEINGVVKSMLGNFGQMTVGESGVISVEHAKDAYARNLPEGKTKEDLKFWQAHRDNFVAAGVQAASDVGFDFLKKNKNVPEVTMSVPYGSDQLKVSIKREKQVRNVQTGEVSTVHGAVGVSFKVSARPNRGELKKVCAGIRERFSAGLAD